MRLRLFIRATVSSALFIGSCLPSMAGVEFTCPVTKPAVVKFEPNGAFAGHAGELFGDEKLFTAFPGAWNFIRPGEQRPENRGYLIPKIVWGSNVFDLNSALTITGHRLDAASEPLKFEGSNLGYGGGGPFIVSAFSVPTLGCWEVTGHFHGADLRIVIDLK